MNYRSVFVLIFFTLHSVDALSQLKSKKLDRLLADEKQSAFTDFKEFLSIPNDANFPDDILRIIDWTKESLEKRGFVTRLLPTSGSDVILAERKVSGATKTLLVYLQSDGQPVDPTAWEQEHPFKPVLKEQDNENWKEIEWNLLDGAYHDDWRIFARSASDSKGPMIQFLSALDMIAAANYKLDYNLKVIVDTEEELGSPNLPRVVEAFRKELTADFFVIFDGPPHYTGEPALKFGARGIATVTLTTYGPEFPQHSGHYGNFLPNPALRLSKLLASMKDDEGRVTLPGFYDGITFSDLAKKAMQAVPDDDEELKRSKGMIVNDQVGSSYQESIQYPSLNIRGMQSGWVGSESRTIIPSTAVAEIDIRLVKESDPERLIGLIRSQIESQGYKVLEGPPTKEERMTYEKIASMTHEVSYAAFRTDIDTPIGHWLTKGMINGTGKEPIKIRTSGGSIPISPFVSTLSVPAVAVGTVNPDNNQHSPNENIRVGDFVAGIKTIAAILSEPLKDY